MSNYITEHFHLKPVSDMHQDCTIDYDIVIDKEVDVYHFMQEVMGFHEWSNIKIIPDGVYVYGISHFSYQQVRYNPKGKITEQSKYFHKHLTDIVFGGKVNGGYGNMGYEIYTKPIKKEEDKDEPKKKEAPTGY